MKGTLSILLVAMLCIGLSGCGSSSSISAADYDTRLTNMMLDMSESELSEISTMIIGCGKKDFEELNGWYYDKDILNKDILCKEILLDGRSIKTEMSLDGNRINEVKYSFNDAIFEDFTGYIGFNALVGIDAPISLREEDEEGNFIFVDISEDGLTDRLIDFVEDNEDLSFSCSWDFANKNETEARIRFSYLAWNREYVGNIYSVYISYSLK